MTDATPHRSKGNGQTPPLGSVLDAQGLTDALNGKWHERMYDGIDKSYGMTNCPAHDDEHPSLRIRDGDGGHIWVDCYARCNQQKVMAAIAEKLDGEFYDTMPIDTGRRAAMRKATNPIKKKRRRVRIIEQSKDKLDLTRWHEAKPATLEDKCQYFDAFEHMHSEVRIEGTEGGRPGTLLVPYRNADAVIVGVETIPPGGKKSGGGYFPRSKRKPVITGSKKYGAVHATTSGTTDQIALAEGLRTAWAVRAATGCKAYSAGGMTNLTAAAQAILKRHPDAEILGCADQHPLGVAVQAMRKAIQAVGGRVAMADFKRPSKTQNDFHDLLRMKNGAARIRQRMSEAEAVKPDKEREPFPLDRTEIGNAEKFVEQHQRIVRNVPRQGLLLVLNGRRWVSDHEAVMRLAIDTIRRLAHEAHEPVNGELNEKRMKWAASCSRNTHLQAIIKIASADERIQAKLSDFDADPWLFNCQNGTLDLRTGKLRPHSSADLITKISPVVFDPDAKCPRWLKFHERISGDNQQIVDFKRRWYGYCLTGDTGEQKFVHAYGSGENGKTKEVEAVAGVLGDYAATADIETLLMRRNSATSSDIVRLAGARFVATSEVPANRRANESKIKLLTGGDKIVARDLYESEVEFYPQLKLVIFGNHRLQISETTHAMWRRALLVDYPVTISPQERDDNLGEKLAAERAGILNWLLQGCLNWQKQGLNPPKSVTRATAKYRREQDIIGSFLKERCKQNADGEVAAAALYERYRNWCEQNGEQPMTAKAFSAAVLERGYTRKRKGAGNFYLGLTFNVVRRRVRIRSCAKR